MTTIDESRQRMVDGLNALLNDEHNNILKVMMTDFYVNSDSTLNTRTVRGVEVMSALDLIGAVCGEITPMIEDGIIQRFE